MKTRRLLSLLIALCLPAAAQTSYTGIVSTRGTVPIAATNAATWESAATAMYARSTIAAGTAQVIYPNFYASAGTSGTAEHYSGSANATFSMQIEYPLGTVYQCTIKGVTVASVPDGGIVVSDVCGPAIPNGALFRVRVQRVGAAGVLFSNEGGKGSTQYDGFTYGTGTPPPFTTSSTIPASDGTNIYQALAVVAPTTNPSVCVMGDSREHGYRESISDNTLDIGTTARALGPRFGYANLGVTSEQASQAIGTGGYDFRRQLWPYCSHGTVEYGGNDIIQNQTAAQALASRATFDAMFAKPIVGVTVLPTTTSTDNWATTTNQTETANMKTYLATFNAAVRAGIAGEFYLFDQAYYLDPGNTGLFPVSYIPGATSGTANYATPDGQHLNSALSTLISRSGAYNADAIRR